MSHATGWLSQPTVFASKVVVVAASWVVWIMISVVSCSVSWVWWIVVN